MNAMNALIQTDKKAVSAGGLSDGNTDNPYATTYSSMSERINPPPSNLIRSTNASADKANVMSIQHSSAASADTAASSPTAGSTATSEGDHSQSPLNTSGELDGSMSGS